jgi:hypothetical protein
VALNGHKIIHFSMEKTIKVISWDRYLVHTSLIWAEFVSDRMSYMSNIKKALVQYYCFECACPM